MQITLNNFEHLQIATKQLRIANNCAIIIGKLREVSSPLLSPWKIFCFPMSVTIEVLKNRLKKLLVSRISSLETTKNDNWESILQKLDEEIDGNEFYLLERSSIHFFTTATTAVQSLHLHLYLHIHPSWKKIGTTLSPRSNWYVILSFFAGYLICFMIHSRQDMINRIP